MKFVTLYRAALLRARLLLLPGLLWGGQVMADLPSVEQPTTGGGGGTYNDPTRQ
ncbi:hypothetical protein NYP84_16835 [Erwinia pyrifoliae]|uniref:Uncharacterized protein n=1 Tax=Erwinia pyrifoliae TaxID=79967 RepID=A0ABY5X795_ERWPY|nr:hypothetical protein NYP84_16835 [Erwinia pyrifoliae]